MTLQRRPYTDEEIADRGLQDWRDGHHELFLADLKATVRALQESVAQMQLILLKNKLVD